jgi:hypothetical protein
VRHQRAIRTILAIGILGSPLVADWRPDAGFQPLGVGAGAGVGGGVGGGLANAGLMAANASTNPEP